MQVHMYFRELGPFKTIIFCQLVLCSRANHLIKNPLQGFLNKIALLFT